jgi:hypothetical protein
MISVFDPTLAPTLALALLTHPFQVALMALAVGAAVREGIRGLVGAEAAELFGAWKYSPEIGLEVTRTDAPTAQLGAP